MALEHLMQKLSDSPEFNMSLPMWSVINRVSQVGLHKVAAPLLGLPEITLKTAAQHLGVRLYRNHLKSKKIASALESLAYLEDTGVITKDASVQLRPTPNMRNTAGNLLRAAQHEAPRMEQMPHALGGAINQGTPGMFASFDKMPTPGFNPKKTIVGGQMGELPPVQRLPTGP